MRNLYRLLGLELNATVDEIRQACHKLSDADRKLIEFILLNPDRRYAYDHAYRTTLMVVKLRHELGIATTTSWRHVTESDWIVVPAQTRTQPPPPRRPPGETRPASVTTENSTRRKWPLGKMVVAGVVLFVLIRACSRDTGVTTDSFDPGLSLPVPTANITDPPPETEAAPVFSEPPQDPPRHGKVFKSRGPGIALFVVDNGTSYDHVIKLVDVSTQKVVRYFYVHQHKRLSIKVPLGTLKMYGQLGDQWYGLEHQFGPDAATFMVDEAFNFEVLDEKVDSWTVTLHKVPGGTATQSQLDPADFDALD